MIKQIFILYELSIRHIINLNNIMAAIAVAMIGLNYTQLAIWGLELFVGGIITGAGIAIGSYIGNYIVYGIQCGGEFVYNQSARYWNWFWTDKIE